MKFTLLHTLLAVSFLLFVNSSFSQHHNTITRDIQYANAKSWDLLQLGLLSKETLTFDLYQPKDFTDSLYPLAIVINGGSFLGSSNKRPDVIAWCDSLSKNGYVAAAINYRVGLNPFYSGGELGPRKGLMRAAYRAIQDCRTAVRYFKHNYDVYNIDTTQINLIGSSSGGIIALHSAFMDSCDTIVECRKNSRWNYWFNNADLGNIDNGGDLNQFYKHHTCQVNSVISLWGGISDLQYISDNDSVNVFLIHGISDNIVPYNTASVFSFGINNFIFPKLYGSHSIHKHMNNLHLPNQCMFFVKGQHALHCDGHIQPLKLSRAGFPGKHWETIYQAALKFLNKKNPKGKPIRTIAQEKQNPIENKL